MKSRCRQRKKKKIITFIFCYNNTDTAFFPAQCVKMAFAHTLYVWTSMFQMKQDSNTVKINTRTSTFDHHYLIALSFQKTSRDIYFCRLWIISHQWGTNLRLRWLDLNFWSSTANYVPRRGWVFVLYLIFCLAVMWDVILNRVGWLDWGPKRLTPLAMVAACTEQQWWHCKGHFHQISPSYSNVLCKK